MRLPASSRVSSSPQIWAGLPRLAAHEIFVGEVGVELHAAQLGHLGVVADQGLGQAAGQPGFAGAGRALEDQVFLSCQRCRIASRRSWLWKQPSATMSLTP